MVKPLRVSDPLRSASNGAQGRSGDLRADFRDSYPDAAGANDPQETERLREENAQLRALCLELEQALQEAATGTGGGTGQGNPAFEAILEEKTEMIRQLHGQVEEMQAALSDAEARAAEAVELAGQSQLGHSDGPAPREEELLSLSEELERERRQLQEDEQTLMDQMREMEVGMARERAELARQRNDLQRLQAEIRHELERLERNGALQTKIDNLKSKLQDVTARRGARADAAPGQVPPPIPGSAPPPPAPGPAKGQGFMGRLFGQGGR